MSHAGVLPRPEALQRLFDAGPAVQDAIDAALPGAVAELVARQAAAGVDIVNDGEISKRGLFIGYIRDRMTGFEAEVPAGTARPAQRRGDGPRPQGLPRLLRGWPRRLRLHGGACQRRRSPAW